MPNLFDPITIGGLKLKNRGFMAPMTRGRAEPDGTPTEIMATYYAQRAEAGLIVTEATAISAQGVGWVNAPGIFTDNHEKYWRPVVDAVHEKNGRIFLQLWHMGRVSHPEFLHGDLPVGPSAIAAEGESHTPVGKKPYVVPRPLNANELPEIAESYAAAALRAIGAGFDGVEIHAANGYLLDQFIRDGSNHREDDYGGPLENRWRFPLEVCTAVCKAIGSNRTAMRLSPSNPYNGMSDDDPVATFSYGAQQLDPLNLAYLHIMEPLPGHFFANAKAPVCQPSIRQHYRGHLVLNGGYLLPEAQEALQEGQADAIAFGVPFLANPDLITRFKRGTEAFNEPQADKFYVPGEAGYTDYPMMAS